jgi:hypothetical protein
LKLKESQKIGSKRRSPSGSRRFCGVIAPLVVLALVAPGSGYAVNPNGAYALGRKAVDRGEWVDAARLLSRALEVDPVETKDTLLSGAYLPDYYLGLSLYELGDCALAMQHLERSRRRGAVLETRQASTLARMMTACDARERLLAQARQEVAAGQLWVDRLEARALDPGASSYWNQGLPPPRLQLREAAGALDRAVALLEGRPGPQIGEDADSQVRILTEDRIADAQQIASQVTTLLKELNEDAEGLAVDSTVDRRALMDEVLELRMKAVWAWGATSPRAKGTRPGRDLADRYPIVTRLHLGDSEVTVSELREVKFQLSSFIEDLGDLPSPRPYRAPAQLREAVEAYFAGQYDTVLALLEDVTFSDRRAQAHQYLFRAAALYSLYAIGEQPDPDLLRAAQSNVRSCLDVNANFQPLAEAFSPKFIEFFLEQRAADPAAAQVTRVSEVR